MVGLGGSAFGRAQERVAADAAQPNPQAASTDSRLPDGTEFVFWEQPLTFSKTYYVDSNSRQGRRQRPRHQRAALPHHQQGRPGPAARRARRHRLRHLPRVRPPGARRHGSGPDDQLRGRPGRDSHRQRLGNPQRGLAAGIRFDGSWPWKSAGRPQVRYPHGNTNSPARCSPMPTTPSPWPASRAIGPGWTPRTSTWGRISAGVDWSLWTANRWSRWSSCANWQARRCHPSPAPTNQPAPRNGLPGRTRGGPIMQEIGGSPDARFWVENSGNAIHIRVATGTPAGHLIEITTREQAFVPMQTGLGLHPRQGNHLPARRQRLPASAARPGLDRRRQSLDHRRQHHRMGQRRRPRHRQRRLE